MLLKRAQVESMKNEIDKLSLQRTKRNSFRDNFVDPLVFDNK
jgi:hypothetical protein